MTGQKFGDWKPGDPIDYIHPEIPEFQLPAYKGERYEVTVPDTLDLQERARLVIHAMTETTDPLADYEPYYIINFRTNPPSMGHNCWFHVLPKYLEGVLLMRLISGSEQNLDVERRWMEVALKSQGEDGLIYTPLQGRPWGLRGAKLMAEGAKGGIKREGSYLLQPFGMGRMLSAMSLFAIRDDDSLWKDAVRKLVDGLIGLAVDTNDIAYFWPTCVIAAKNPPTGGEVPTPAANGESSRIPHGLVHAYRLLGYEPALTLANKIITYMRRYFYTEKGEFLRTPDDSMMAHFHRHANGLLAMAEYAKTVGDEELMEFVVRSFQYAESLGCSLEGPGYAEVKVPRANPIGYFPEYVNSPEWEGSEICEVSDMIALALFLSEQGIGDYWDDADRWIRNMLAEGQLLSTDWIYRISETGLINARSFPSSVVGPYDTAERVPERSLGAFAGWPAANDWYVGNGPGIMQCCTTNGARTLYWIWERILRYKEGKLRVNLLLNRASPWADVESCLPYQGKVEVKVKTSCELSIRIPEWVSPNEVRCQVQGKERSLSVDGRYVQVGEAKPQDTVTLTFPIKEKTCVVHIEKQRFTLIQKGNEVVSISPPGRLHPLYQREHYRNSTPRWRKITRFVSDEQIDW